MSLFSKILEGRQKVRYNRHMSDAFKAVFPIGIPWTADVLGHLRNFCFANATTVTGDAHACAVAQGRREVWLEIEYYRKLTHAELDEIDWQFKRQMADVQARELN